MRRSRFEFGLDDWVTALPVLPWTPADNTVGGTKVSASGLPVSYVVRRDAQLELTVRVREDEWENVLALVAHGQTGQTLTWFPDAEDLGDSRTVYLDAPAPGERWAPTRDGNYPRVMQVTLTFRDAAAVAPWLPYFDG